MKKPTGNRKSEIVQSALDLTEVSGVGMLSTTAIAGMIGISQPAIFRHFPTKAALWQGVANYLVDEMTARWSEALGQALPPSDRLLALAESQLTFIALHPAVLDIVFSRQLHSDNPAVKADFQRLMAALFAHFEALVIEAAPDLPRDTARDTALVIGGTIQATALRWSLNTKGFDLVAEGQRLIARQMALLDMGARK
jgi:AcrR family transcriptional regulator